MSLACNVHRCASETLRAIFGEPEGEIGVCPTLSAKAGDQIVWPSLAQCWRGDKMMSVSIPPAVKKRRLGASDDEVFVGEPAAEGAGSSFPKPANESQRLAA